MTFNGWQFQVDARLQKSAGNAAYNYESLGDASISVRHSLSEFLTGWLTPGFHPVKTVLLVLEIQWPHNKPVDSSLKWFETRISLTGKINTVRW